MTIQILSKQANGWTLPSDLEIITFPGGEPHARVIPDKQSSGPMRAQIAIVRQPTMHDLVALAALKQLIDSRGEEFWLSLPYIPFGRDDHVGEAQAMAVWMVNYLHELSPHRMVFLDPHSDYITGWLDGFDFRLLDLPTLVADATAGVDYDGVVAPDKGAAYRAGLVAQHLGVPLYLAGKTRDFETGKLTGFHMEDQLPEQGHFLLVDDICDGGGTFNGLVHAIREAGWNQTFDLWVSHGIFSKGFGPLLEHFENIYTTNSWANPEEIFWDDLERVFITDLTPTILHTLSKENA